MTDLPVGWFSDHDIQTYRKFVSLVPPRGRLVELGSWMGRSMCSVADLIIKHDLEVIAVDHFLGTDGDVCHDEARRGVDIEQVFRSNLAAFGLTDRVQVVRNTTIEALQFVPDNSVNLIFLDADHRTSNVLQDIIAWHPKLKSNGVLIGHDLVRQTVGNAVLQSGLPYKYHDNMWWIIKREKGLIT